MAVELARSKPESCKRSLEYLPYAKVKTTKGAWLAAAIRDEFGPPAAYEHAIAKRTREEQATRQARDDDARRMRQEARSCKKKARLRERYAEMEKAHGGAMAAFTDHLAKERARLERFATNLSEAGKEKLLSAFDSPERRLEVFELWLKRSGLLDRDQGFTETLGRPAGEGGITSDYSSLPA